MISREHVYCSTCGRASRPVPSTCEHCGAPLTPSRWQRVRGIAFLLNQMQRSPMRDMVPEPALARLIERYERELQLLRGPAPLPSSVSAGAAEAPASPAARKPAARRVTKPRAPRDWSWLADQQANLFLFAGAFLVVIAALIYVGYSGQAVAGALKMALMASYTLAFLAAGVACLRFPKVEIAGRVFVGASAFLVPLNFVLADTIISEKDLSREAMWLAGSLTTATFYAGVGALGLGRQYSFASGVALVSAATATVFLADLPVEWAPIPYLSLAIGMAFAENAAPEGFRARVGLIWAKQAHAVTVLSLAFTLLAALAANADEELSTRWFATPAAGLGLAFYATEAMLRQQRLAVTGGAVSLAGLSASLVFGADISSEYYAFALIGTGLAILAMARWGVPRLPERFMPTSLRTDAVSLAHVATAGGVLVAVLSAVAAANPDTEYTPQTPWFLMGAFAAAAAVYALHVTMPMPVLGEADMTATYGFGLSLVGTATAIVYGAEWSAEYYSFAFAAGAAPLLALATWGMPSRFGTGPPGFRRDCLLLAHAAALPGGAVAIGAVVSAAGEDATYAPETPWFLPALFGSLGAFYALALLSRFRPSPEATAAAAAGLAASVFGVTTGVVYALEVSAEYYAFAFVVPAVVLGAAAHWPPGRGVDDVLPAGWRAGAIACGRLASLAGIAVAIAAALVAAEPDATYVPDSRVFLPLASVAAAAFFALDAAREKRWETSAALLVALGGAGVTIAYAAEADAEYYGVALACTGLTYGFGGRIWLPSWLDERARDQTGAAAVTLGWLPFEGVYDDHLRIGAGTHLAAAVFYAGAAVVDRSEMTLTKLLDIPYRVPVRVAAGWLYAAGVTVAIGYVDIMRSLPGGEEAEAESLTLPLMGLSLAFLVSGALLRWGRPDFRIHVYVMALLISIASISTAGDSGTLTMELTVLAAAFLAIAAWEDAPVLAAPSPVFGFAAIVALREYADWPPYSVPMAYSAVAVVAYGAGFALRTRLPRWSDALRAAGAAYAIVSPAVGFGILAANTEEGLIDGGPFETSALYEWSTLATGLVGLLGLVESSIARRGWVVVGGSAVMLVALLLQIGRFHPENVQAYTAVIGTYLVLLGLVGLSRYRLLPGLEETATYVEGLGAAIIMFPSFLQSLEGGWRYELILLVEAVGFLTAGVTLRRRGLLATSLAALVLVAGRVLFDAINALPNWIVALILGMMLLGLGMGVLIGRERWTRWEEQVASWWDQTGTP